MKLLLLTSMFILCLTGCATPGGSGPPANDGGGGVADAQAIPNETSDPSDADLPEVSAGPDLLARAQSAMEGAVLGAVIGAQAGPIGAAVGAGALLVYGAITGHVPLAGSGAPGGNSRDEDDRERDMEEELRKEEQRGEHLEDEIEAELKRQEDLLREIEAVENQIPAEDAAPSQGVASVNAPAPEPESPSDASLSERANPRAAPKAPRDRELPLAIFDKEKVTIPRGAWQNERKLTVVKRSLDADMDGRPEQIRYYDTESDTLIRLEQDTDYDGDLDTWQTYEDGKLATRQIDASDNGRPDVWETYRALVMRSRDVDRDGDGLRDAFYEYESDSLIRERHDANGDGTPDLVVHYENRLRVRAEEDGDRDGRMDTWTTYTPFEGEELVARIERDTDGSGKVDLVETYGEIEGRATLTRREEDKNGDGEMDIKSIYENGKLVRREISDPSLVPL
jgi:antitoxin component YwqK of YwqJK toxin-antitoxin module